MKYLVRLNLHQRLQHGLLVVLFLLALGSGAVIAFSVSAMPLRGYWTWYRLHLWAGTGTALYLLYHFLYVIIRGYVEGSSWRYFPLRLLDRDFDELSERFRYVFGALEQRPEAGIFSATQKVFYWATVILLAGICLTGAAMSFWRHTGTLVPLWFLGQAAVLHRGLTLLAAVAVAWHLYGTLVWEGAWRPDWSWITGKVSEDWARQKVPGFVRDQERREKEEMGRIADEHPDGRQDELRKKEKEDVEADLLRGNELAREEKFVEALAHYRRAIEKFPGYSQAHYNMAKVFQKMGERRMAADAYRRFLENDPFHPLAGDARQVLEELKREGEE